MADIDCSVEMLGFHRSEVTLPKSAQDEMRGRRDNGRVRLESGLNLKTHPQPADVESQGSYAMRTMVQDAACDYDIDDGAYFRSEDLLDANGASLTPLAARERICDALKWDGRLAKDAEVLRNCVRQAYPQGYHIDVPVYRIVVTKNDKDEDVQHFELASENAWVRSDARSVSRWYRNLVGELNSGEADGSQMRRITKLSKKLARSRPDWKSQTTSGICVTKLVADHFVANAGRDDRSLRDTWKAIKTALDVSTEIEHPVLENVKLAKTQDPQVEFFNASVGEALTTLGALDVDGCTRASARETWDEVFNTKYFSDQPDTDDKKAFLTVTSVSTAKRDDGGGRFG